MQQTILLIIITTIFCTGLYVSGQKPFILSGLRTNIAVLLGGSFRADGVEYWFEFTGTMKHLWKPFWGCLTCMSSLWGIAIYFIYAVPSVNTFYELPIQIIGAAGLNNIIGKWLDL